MGEQRVWWKKVDNCERILIITVVRGEGYTLNESLDLKTKQYLETGVTEMSLTLNPSYESWVIWVHNHYHAYQVSAMNAGSLFCISLMYKGKLNRGYRNKESVTLNMKTRGRKDGDTAGSPSTKIQGIGNVTEPCNSIAKMFVKRMWCSNHTNSNEDSEASVEASVDARSPWKKTRCSINNTRGPSLLEVSSLKIKKRKVSDDGDAPKKRMSCSNSSSSGDSLVTVSGASLPRDELKVDVTSDDSESDVSLNFSGASRRRSSMRCPPEETHTEVSGWQKT